MFAASSFSADASRKGRYAPLEALVPRLGAARLLELQPDLVGACLHSMAQNLISSAVGGLLVALVAQLQWEAEQAARAAAASGGSVVDCNSGAWRACWLPQLAGALRSGSEMHRDNLAAHLLPRLLSQDPPALGLLLQQLLPGASSGSSSSSSSEGAVAGCLAVLKAARRQQLLADLHQLPVAGLDAAAVRSTLMAAVRSSSEGIRWVGRRREDMRSLLPLITCWAFLLRAGPKTRLKHKPQNTCCNPARAASRVDALTMVCCHPKTTALPTELELAVAAEAVRLSLRQAPPAAWAGLAWWERPAWPAPAA
jgi:hypothetical protein